ncbi:hypothetical protein FACS1894214_4710 [Planctomycetales bacterium]|nr:hypothetical protein FACS1894214_4710 [Planctomycetales bacterium]
MQSAATLSYKVSNVHPNDLQKLITKRLKEFRNLFPEYKGHKIFLAVAGMAFDERVQEDAKAAGVAVLKQQGKVMICDTENMKEF